MPFGSSGGAMGMNRIALPAHFPKGPVALLKMQAEGKLAGPVLPRILRAQYRELNNKPVLHFPVKKDGGVGIWTSLTNYNALLGTNKGGGKVKAAINTYNNGSPGCEDPIGVKVDHNGNIWAGCEYSSSGQNSAQEWNASGTPVATYSVNCPEGGSKYCAYDYSYGFDAAASSSYVFAAQTFFEYDECTPSCAYVYGGGFQYWPAGSPTSTPTEIALPYGPVYDVYYMDLDSSGNIWFDYYGCPTSGCGYGLAEVTNPTSSPSMVSIVAPGKIGYAGGVYVAANGDISVIDQNTHEVYVYNSSGSLLNTLGPTAFGIGDPVTGDYGSGDTKMAIGDADDWLDLGTVSSNKWKVGKPALAVSSLEGAAITPSDK